MLKKLGGKGVLIIGFIAIFIIIAIVGEIMGVHPK